MKLTWQGHVIASDVTVPAGVREVTRDIDIPDLRVGGLVVNDDTGEPIAGARATATRKGEGDGRLSLNAYWSESGETEGLAMGTVPEVNDTTGPDGRFELLLPGEGPWTVASLSLPTLEMRR